MLLSKKHSSERRPEIYTGKFMKICYLKKREKILICVHQQTREEEKEDKPLKKKVIAALMAGIMTASLMAGCSSVGGEQTTAQDETSEQEDGERKVEGELKLALFQGGYGAEYWEELITKFEEKYPDVEVTYEINPKIGDIIRPKIISGDVPDLIYHNTGNLDGVMTGLVKDHALMDISDLFEEEALDKEGKLKDIILPGMLEGAAYAPYGDGKIYFAPFNTAPQGLIYNKTLFEEKGWEVPETWEEFYALGDEAKKEDRALITYPGLYPGYLRNLVEPEIASNAGVDALDDIYNYREGCWEQEGVQEVLENVRKLYEGGYVLDGSAGMNHTQSQSEMMLGKALFIPNGTWIENEMKDAPREGDDAFEFALLPSLKTSKDDTTYVSTSIEQISIPKDAKNPEAAKEFIKFIYTDESVKLFGEKTGGAISVTGATELIKDYISPSQYNMLSAMSQDGIETFSGAYAAMPKNAKFSFSNVFEDGVVPLISGDMSVEDCTKLAEDGFASIRELQEEDE